MNKLISPNEWYWHFNNAKNRLYVTVKTASGVMCEGALPLGKDLLIPEVLHGVHSFTREDIEDYVNFMYRLADFSFKSDEKTYLALNATALRRYGTPTANLDQCFTSLVPEAEAQTPEIGEVVIMYPGYSSGKGENGRNFQVIGVDKNTKDCYCMLIGKEFCIKPGVQMNRGACVKVSPTKVATIGYIRRHSGRLNNSNRKVAR
jgi:hypothetical protein